MCNRKTVIEFVSIDAFFQRFFFSSLNFCELLAGSELLILFWDLDFGFIKIIAF